MKTAYRTTEDRFTQYEIREWNMVDIEKFVEFTETPEQADTFGDIQLIHELPVPDMYPYTRQAWRFFNLRDNPRFERIAQVTVAGNHSAIIYNPETTANDAYNAYLFLHEYVPTTQETVHSLQENVHSELFDIHVDYRFSRARPKTYDDIKAMFSAQLSNADLRKRRHTFEDLEFTRCQAIATMARGSMRHDHETQILINIAREKLHLSDVAIICVWRVAETIALLANSPIIKAEHAVEAIQYRKETIIWDSM
jgi:Magnesium chelatase, subunit ChlI C-terminal